jgi:hypothetical protein
MALAAGLGLIAMFSLISILLGQADTRQSNDPRDDPFLWMFLARR